MKKFTFKFGRIAGWILVLFQFSCEFQEFPFRKPKVADGKLVFWNQLGSDEEVLNSKVGPGLEFYPDGDVQINRLYVPGVVGNAISMDPKVISSEIEPLRAPNLVLKDLPSLINPERGTIECFYYQVKDPSFDLVENYHIFDGPRGLGSGMGFLNQPLGDQPGDDDDFAYSEIIFFLDFGGHQESVSYPNFGFEYDRKWVHLAVAWDRSGIGSSPETIQLYINGIKVDSTTGVGWGTEVGHQADIAGGTSEWWDFWSPFFYVDELKIYDFAKQTFNFPKL